MARNILITGASGLVGTRLTEMLLEKGHSVSHVGRTKRSGAIPVYIWDIGLGIIDPKAIASADTIIHLAGAGVAESRWTKKRKDEILQSRIKSTGLLFNALKKGTNPVKSFISASAVGYYGFESNALLRETSPPGHDFLAQVTQQWESGVDKMSSLGLRVIKMRIGIVLSEKGGALRSMALPVRWGLGAPLGSGTQCISWIHIDDLCTMFVKAVDDDTLHGAYNAVSSNPVTNIEMTKTIARVLRRPLWLPPVPPFVLKLLLGEMADLVTGGSCVSPEKILNTGFEFQFASLEGALRNLFKR